MYQKGAILLLILSAIMTSLFWYHKEADLQNGTAAFIGDTDGQIDLSPMSPIVSPTGTRVINVTDTNTSIYPVPSSLTSPTPASSPKMTVSAAPISSQTPTSSRTPMSTPTNSLTATPSPLGGIEQSGVVINEIAWMGTFGSTTDEWIELYNSGSQPVLLDGWRLDSVVSVLSGTIQSGGYFLIERTNDNTISDISADLVTSFSGGGLNNSGEAITLINALGAIADRVNGSSGPWYAGDNTQKASMERVSPGSPGDSPDGWKTNDGSNVVGHDAEGSAIVGTPKAKNSVSP